MRRGKMSLLSVHLRSIVGRLGLATIAATLLLALVIVLGVLTDHIARAEGAFGLGNVPFLQVGFGVAMAMALLFPAVVWAGLPPNARVSLHAMPMPRWRHEMLRVAAGAILVLLAVLVIMLVCVACALKFTIGVMPWPQAADWAVAAMSLGVLYLLGSLAGLLTQSTLGTLMRLGVWTMIAWIALSLAAERRAGVASVRMWILDHLVHGPVGLQTGVFAGLRALQPGVETAPMASGAWLLVSLLLVCLSAGRHPSRARG